MSEGLRFDTFVPAVHSRQDIYAIGATGERAGVIPEMAAAFGHTLTDVPTDENLGELIGAVGPAKQLQDNIGVVQARLETQDSPVALAQDWVERSGFRIPVDRMFASGEQTAGGTDIAIITDGVLNWMNRRAARALGMHVTGGVGRVLLAGGTLVVKVNGIEMTAAEYQKEILKPRLKAWEIPVETITVDSKVGEDIAAAVAARVKEVAEDTSTITVIGNAGSWVQNGGTILRALRAQDVASDVRVVSDPVNLGDTTQLPLTHQNPYTALGQVARNAQELARHTS